MKTFYQAINPMLLTCKLFGLVPFAISAHGYSASKLNIFFNVLMSILYLFLSIYVLYLRVQLTASSALSTTTDVLQITSTAIQTVVVWISSACFWHQHVKLLNKLEEVGKKFQTLGVWIYYDTKQWFIYAQIIARIIVVLTSIMVQTAVYKFGGGLNMLGIQCTFYFPVVLNSAVCQQVSIYIKTIKENYKVLNEHLLQLHKYPDAQNTQGLKAIAFLRTKLSMLHIISPLHHELCKMVFIINNTFGMALLAFFGVTFVTIIIDLYYSIVVIQTPTRDTLPVFLATVCNCGPYLMDAIVLCYLCKSTCEEANLSGMLVHNLDSDEKEVKNQVEIFSLQLAHEKVEFNAAGFFPINYTLIFAIIGGVTTNLVILIQFSTTSLK